MRTKKLFLFLILFLFSCAAHRDNTVKAPYPPKTESHGQDSVQASSQLKSIHQRKTIIQHAMKSLGRPYKWGGMSPKTGFDCSGLIVYTYQKANIVIPRTTQLQFNNGTPVPKQKLQIADLVFFKHPDENKVFHVGIYTGDGAFVHAPGKGRHVTHARLTNPYFQKYYMGSRTYF